MKGRSIIHWLRTYWPSMVGASLGVGLGVGYYLTVGCATGGCPITSSPYVSAAFGGLFGFMLGSEFVKHPLPEPHLEEEPLIPTDPARRDVGGAG